MRAMLLFYIIFGVGLGSVLGAVLHLPLFVRHPLRLQPVAYVEVLSGRVRLKQPRRNVWQNLRRGYYLRPGSLIYVPEGAFVDVNYFREKVRISYANASLYAIEHRAPRLPMFRKQFDVFSGKRLSRKQAELQKPDFLSFHRVVNHPGAEDRRLLSHVLEQEKGSLAIVRETRLLRLRDRQSQLRYFVTGEHALFDVEMQDPNLKELVYGFIWREGALAPTWSGVARRKFSGIVLPVGDYTFQAISESESAVSDPLQIKVGKHPSLEWPGSEWKNGEVHIYQ